MANGINGGGPAAAEAAARVRDQVKDALELAQYVVANGVKDGNGEPLAFDNIATIQTTAGILGLLEVNGGGTAPKAVSAAQWNAFEQAYYRLAIATSPITAETLRNTYATSSEDGTAHPAGILSRIWEELYNMLTGFSPAQRFTRGLLYVTIAFAAFVLLMETLINWLGMKTNAEDVKVWKDLCQSLVPWAYGGLGACAYLLRSAHTYIYQRCFDLRRKPEYTNRILLGAISGGAIILFADYLISQDDSYTHFGAAALGFLAGYSTDFLFNTVERIVTAIFPKVSVETVAKDAKPAPAKRSPPKKPDKTKPGDTDNE